jgi:predicted regulator of Ras-like GTPase activity (Roadblock/LC7/MglB family)
MSPLATTLLTPDHAQKQHLGFLLNGFCHDVAHISYVLAVSGDGITLAASDQVPAAVRDQLAAAASGLHSLGTGIGRLMSTEVDKTVLQFPHGWMIMQPTSARIFLLALTDINAELGQIHYELIRLGESIGELLDPGARANA